MRVEDRGRGIDHASWGLGLGLMIALADRIEIGPSLGGPGTSVLMEFPVESGARADESIAAAARLGRTG